VNVSYTEPLASAWARMKRMLFRPFRIEDWLTYGLAAFLAHLASSGNGASYGTKFDRWKSTPDDPHAFDGVREKILHVLSDPGWLLLIATILVFVGVVLLVIFWVSARAQFIFVENVLTGRPAFVDPWKRHARLGRSLFLWLAAFSFAWLVPIAFVLVPLAGTLGGFMAGQGIHWPGIALIAGGASMALLTSLVLAFVHMLVHQFIVPLMYRYDENATQAWARFWPLLTSRFGDFFAFAIFLLVAWIVVTIGVVIAGLATCCIGLILLAIPYIGTVLLLPIEVTARGFGPDFLRQFGREWDVFPAAEAPAAAPPTSPPPAF